MSSFLIKKDKNSSVTNPSSENLSKNLPKNLIDKQEGTYKSPFISFSYSYKSMYYADGKTHVKAKEERFVDGRFDSQEFEGTLEGHTYNNALEEIHKSFTSNLLSFFNSSFLLPFFRDKDGKK